MRGREEKQGYMFSYLSPEQRVPADHPLRAIMGWADQALRRLSPVFERMYARMGRPSIPPERLLKISPTAGEKSSITGFFSNRLERKID